MDDLAVENSAGIFNYLVTKLNKSRISRGRLKSGKKLFSKLLAGLGIEEPLKVAQ